MDILGLMAVLSFGLTCFGIGYSISNSCWASVSADVLLYIQYTAKSKVPQVFFSDAQGCFMKGLQLWKKQSRPFH